MFFFFLNILNILKLYKKKKKLLIFFFNLKGKYFSKIYRKYKFVKFPNFKYWYLFNKSILKFYFFNKNKIILKYSFLRSIIFNKFLKSYYNIKKYNKLSNLILILKKKFNFRLRNFFFFLNYV